MDLKWDTIWRTDQPNTAPVSFPHCNRATRNASAPLVWAGMLAPQHTLGASFSSKVFIGGVPWDISDTELVEAFGRFGPIKVEWPIEGKLQETELTGPAVANGAKNGGYLYLVMENENAVIRMLGSCGYEADQTSSPRFFTKVSSERIRNKQVQIIPWQMCNAKWTAPGYAGDIDLDAPHRTIFVGSLHGQITAEGLARVMGQLFGEVVSAELDTDKYKYPIGSGRVIFKDFQNYALAVQSGSVQLETRTFRKRLQIDPFLHETVCSVCQMQPGPLFCRDMACLKYFCNDWWVWEHSLLPVFRLHRPMMRKRSR